MDEFEQKCVLVVEDNGRLRATVRELLRWQCYRVKESGRWSRGFHSSSRDAAGCHPDRHVQVGQDGATFIQPCRRTPGLDNVPIVVMSGQDESDMTRERLRAARVSADLVKPFGVEELSTAVECDTLSS